MPKWLKLLGIYWKPDGVAPVGVLFQTVAGVGFVCALFLNLCALWVSWNQPIIDLHGFRQTQTALSAYWLMHGGNWLAYETPVLGAPWSIPMEFPLYQWMVAAVAWIAPITLDQAGRAVSQTFFFLCMWPLWILCRELNLGRATWLATAALMMMAPVYVFWSRSFMIESTALFLALFFVASYLRWINTSAWPSAASALIFLSLALLVKVTTAVPLGVLAVILSIAPAVAHLRERKLGAIAVKGGVAVAIAVLGMLLAVCWIAYADHLKARNPFGSALTSQAIFGWNFGSLEQRTSPRLWVTVIAGRAVPEALGAFAVPVSILLALAHRISNRVAPVVAAFFLAWLSAFLIFTNLHIVHNYYQYSNAVLLIAAVGIVIGDTARRRATLATGVLAIALSMQCWEFKSGYGSLLPRDLSKAHVLQVAQILRQETPPGSAIVVAIHDWSPVIGYYSERKSLTFPKWSDEATLEKFAAAPASFVAPLSTSAVVVCHGQSPPLVRRAVYRALEHFEVQRVGGIHGCEVSLLK